MNAQVPLFELVVAGLVFGATLHAARQSEREELLAQSTLRALRHSNQQLNQTIVERQIFTALVENSPDFIGMADANGRPIYLNPAGRRMVGLAPDFPVGGTAMPITTRTISGSSRRR